nr:unnamed protein product [Digitaria exilis]
MDGHRLLRQHLLLRGVVDGQLMLRRHLLPRGVLRSDRPRCFPAMASPPESSCCRRHFLPGSALSCPL